MQLKCAFYGRSAPHTQHFHRSVAASVVTSHTIATTILVQRNWSFAEVAMNQHRTRRTPQIYLGVGANGRHYGASTASPYFYFEGPSEQDVVFKVRAAVRFYDRCRGKEPNPVSEAAIVPLGSLRPSKILDWDTLG
jgi:hypothetical protein